MERTCCRRRPATNKRGGSRGTCPGSGDRGSDAGADLGSAVSTDAAPDAAVVGASAAKRPRGTPPPARALSSHTDGHFHAGASDVVAASVGTSPSGLPAAGLPRATVAGDAARLDGSGDEAVGAARVGALATSPRHMPATALMSSATSPDMFDGFRRRDLIRLMLQALSDLGLSASGAALERESGISAETSEVSALRQSVLAASWMEAVASLEQLETISVELRHTIRFLILQQKFLEYLAQRAGDLAHNCLQEELFASTFDDDTREWVQLAHGYLDCGSQEELERISGWRLEGSREAVWERILDLLPPHLVVPPRRLSVLLWQAVRYQEMHCLHHSLGAGLGNQCPASLLQDHVCEPPPLPAHCVARLDGHADEVWFVAASHSGQNLASASRDKAVLLWEHVPPVSFKVVHALCGHTEPCSHLAWSPDDKYLLTASSDCTVRLWAPPRLTAVDVLVKHSSPVTSVGWLSDSCRFVTAGFDCKVCLWHTDGTELHTWEIPGRIQDMAVMHSGTRVLIVNSDRNLKIIDAISRRELPALPEGDAVTSVCASRLRDDVLVNIAYQVSSSQQAPVIRLWDIEARRVVQRYVGHSQGRFVVRSCFGGRNEEFVISGSEDAQVYIWHRHFGSLLQVLSGHAATVNAVCWAFAPCSEVVNAGPASQQSCSNLNVGALLISAADDHTLRVWGPSSAATYRAETPNGESADTAAEGWLRHPCDQGAQISSAGSSHELHNGDAPASAEPVEADSQGEGGELIGMPSQVGTPQGEGATQGIAGATDGLTDAASAVDAESSGSESFASESLVNTVHAAANAAVDEGSFSADGTAVTVDDAGARQTGPASARE